MTKQQGIGLENTTAYLTADPIDVYVATSMREPWEYVTTAAAIDRVFQGSAERLRYFDPRAKAGAPGPPSRFALRRALG